MPENLRVWAPRAGRLTLHLTDDKREVPMVPLATVADGAGLDTSAHSDRATQGGGADGWWVSPEPLSPGTRYLLAVDDNPPFPDPRTRRQPEGVHGPSEIVDVASFPWTDAQWTGIPARGAITYELHVGTFTPEGTFAAAIEKLPHLVDLGVDLIEVMPIVPVPGARNWGYDGVELYAVTENYGGPEGFAAFVDAAHALGLGVCLDVVYNHLGPDGNYLSVFGPYFTDTHMTPWGDAVNLDGENSGPVRRFIIDNALQWVRDYHVDALRLDAVAHLVDDSERHILAELADEVHAFAAASGRHIGLIAESDLNDPRMVTPTSEGGLGMDCQWDDDVHHALHVAATGETFAYYEDFTKPGSLEKVFRHAFAHDGNYSTFREQYWGAPVPEGMDGRAFVACTEDHDQVGNRAIGDRPSASLSQGQVAAQLALLLGSPFTPMLFMGQEWGTRRPFQFFTDHVGDLGEAVAKGRQEEFAGWDWLGVYGADSVTVPNPQDDETFLASKLDWAEVESEEYASFFDFTKQLIALRKQIADFASGDLSGSEIVRLGGSGYLRRGDSYVVFSFEEDSRVAIPAPGDGAMTSTPTSCDNPSGIATSGLTAVLSWGEPAIEHTRPGVLNIHFTEPGVAVLTPAISGGSPAEQRQPSLDQSRP